MDETFEFSATQTAAGTSSQGSDKYKSTVSVVLNQLIECPESNFQMFGMTFGIVSCAVIIRSIDTSSTKITYVLEDHTGRIEGHYWLDEESSIKSPDIMVNNYALVYGCLRQQGEQKSIMIMKMEQINDPNEICTHLLEVLYSHYKAQEFQKSEVAGNSRLISSGDFHMKEDDASLGLQTRELAVYRLIKSCKLEEGIGREELHNKMQHITKTELNTMLDFLISEGHIYTTKDVDHFMSTDQ